MRTDIKTSIWYHMIYIYTLLRYDLDGIITNMPTQLSGILNEPQFSLRYRPATPEDDAFQLYTGHGAQAYGCLMVRLFLEFSQITLHQWPTGGLSLVAHR